MNVFLNVICLKEERKLLMLQWGWPQRLNLKIRHVLSWLERHHLGGVGPSAISWAPGSWGGCAGPGSHLCSLPECHMPYTFLAGIIVKKKKKHSACNSHKWTMNFCIKNKPVESGGTCVCILPPSCLCAAAARAAFLFLFRCFITPRWPTTLKASWGPSTPSWWHI